MNHIPALTPKNCIKKRLLLAKRQQKTTMKSKFTAILVLLCLSVAIQADSINWGNITASELSNLPISAFQDLSALKVSVIPPEAFDGFDAPKISALSYLAVYAITDDQLSHLTTACAGFNAVQVSRLRARMTAECLPNLTSDNEETSGCAGLQYNQVSSMDLQTLSGGFTTACMNATKSNIFMFFNATQLSALGLAACAGLRTDHVYQMPTSAAPGLTKHCLAHFTTGDRSACRGITGDFIQDVPATTFQGFSSNCINSLLDFVFSNISAEQVQNIPATSFAGFYTSVLHWMPSETVRAISLDQLSYLSPMGFVSLFPNVLADFVNEYQLSIVNRWTIDQVKVYDGRFLSVFLGMIPSRVPTMTSWSELSQHLSQVTWLQLALVKGDPQPILDGTALSQLAPHTFSGLRGDLVQLIQPSDFVHFTPNVTKHLTNVTTAAISAQQIVHFPADSITWLSYDAFSALTPSAFSALTYAQMAVLTSEQFKYLSCRQIEAFSTAQAEHLSEDAQNFYYYAMIRCKAAYPPSAPHSSAPLSTPINAPNTEVSSPVNSPSSDVLVNKLPPGAVVAIVMSSVAGLTIMIGVVVFIILKRRNESGLYAHLLSTEAQTPLVNKI